MTQRLLDRPATPSLKLRAVFIVYQAIAHLLFPVAVGVLLFRSIKEPLYRAHFGQRLGIGPTGPRGAVWVFAASLGETRAVSPLVHHLVRAGHQICLTHSSPVGLAEGRRLFKGLETKITHRYVPLDLLWCVFLFLARLRPCLGLVVESEHWPGKLFVARWLGIPMVQVNGNLVDRSIERDEKRLGGVRLELLGMYHAILTKTETYEARYRRAGVDPERIHIVGELKFDQSVDAHHLRRAEELRTAWSSDRPVFMIASSVAGEEEDLMQLVADLKAIDDAPRLIWVPRSPQDFSRIAGRLVRAGWTSVRRTEVLDEDLGGTLSPDAEILVGDSIGEMNFYYAMADAVFVGASLVPRGGHNIVEPLALGLPVMMGPSIFGITYPAEDAREAGALFVASGIEDLTRFAVDLMSNPTKLDAQRAKAKKFSARHLGASERTFDVLAPFLQTREN